MTSLHCYHRPGGFTRGSLMLLIIMAALLVGGGQEIYTAFKNRQPLVITCQQYLDKRPTAEWVTITEARFDFLNSAVQKIKFVDKTSEVFIPLRGKTDNPSRAIQLLLASKKPETISLMESMSAALERAKTPADLDPELLKKLTQPQTVSGVVRFGISADSKTERKLAALNLPLAEGYVMLSEGEEPGMLKGIALFSIGLLLLAYNIRRWTGGAKKTPPPLPPRES